MIKYTATMLYHEKSNMCRGVQKAKGPEAVLGKWNYIGGKVEGDESIFAAHSREFREETGLRLEEIAYHKAGFSVRFGDHSEVDFKRFDLFPHLCKEDLIIPKSNDVGEVVRWIGLGNQQLVPNLYWITPALLDGVQSGALLT